MLFPNEFCFRCRQTKEIPSSSHFMPQSHFSCLNSEVSKSQWTHSILCFCSQSPSSTLLSGTESALFPFISNSLCALIHFVLLPSSMHGQGYPLHQGLCPSGILFHLLLSLLILSSQCHFSPHTPILEQASFISASLSSSCSIFLTFHHRTSWKKSLSVCFHLFLIPPFAICCLHSHILCPSSRKRYWGLHNFQITSCPHYLQPLWDI